MDFAVNDSKELLCQLLCQHPAQNVVLVFAFIAHSVAAFTHSRKYFLIHSERLFLRAMETEEKSTRK
jgi:hypothetical protein